MNDPSIIYADEPTANLDTAAARTVMETLRKLNETLDVTVLFVSHDPDDARYASQLIHLSDGKLSDGQSGRRPVMKTSARVAVPGRPLGDPQQLRHRASPLS